jgi:hypothetical protein
MVFLRVRIRCSCAFLPFERSRSFLSSRQPLNLLTTEICNGIQRTGGAHVNFPCILLTSETCDRIDKAHKLEVKVAFLRNVLKKGMRVETSNH